MLQIIKEHDMHIEPKSSKLKLLGKLVVQQGIRSWFAKGHEFKPLAICMFVSLICFSSPPLQFFNISLPQFTFL